MRARLRIDSPAWFAHPRKTSSIGVGKTGVAAHQLADGQRREIVGADAGQRAAVAADWRANVVANEGLSGHGFSAR